MRVVGRHHIAAFQTRHPTSRAALNRWCQLVSGVLWHKPQDAQQLFGRHVNFIKQKVVFDVGGNKMRLIAKIDFKLNLILVTHVLTHNQYDKQKWRE